jgi:hypothetical protein
MLSQESLSSLLYPSEATKIRGSGVFFDFNSAPKVAPNEFNLLRKKIAIFVNLWDSTDLKFQI